MKRIILIWFISGILFPVAARGEDITLLLTLKDQIDQAPVKTELRAGLWEKGKDGLDASDVQAMVNGSVDAYFEIPSDNGNDFHKLWWDIRSLNPSQEWKLHINAPAGSPVVLEWKKIVREKNPDPVSFILLDPETGHETDLNQPAGSVQLTIQGTKNLILKSFLK
ncbi:MAG: hypothetical protein ACYDBV_05300 [Nitrospiria bacterium]